jgi:hypothetical protein
VTLELPWLRDRRQAGVSAEEGFDLDDADEAEEEEDLEALDAEVEPDEAEAEDAAASPGSLAGGVEEPERGGGAPEGELGRAPVAASPEPPVALTAEPERSAEMLDADGENPILRRSEGLEDS